VIYSTKYFKLAGSSRSPLFEPDVRVTRSLADALAGKDPVMEEALRR
jgi:hypothetical protein